MPKGSLNKTLHIGRLTADPILKYTPQGAAVCNFDIATNEGYKDSNGNQVDKVEYHKIVIWRKLAEIAGQYLKKGSLVYIEGKLQTRTWEKDGQKHYTTEIVVSEMQMLGSKSAENAQATQAKPQAQPAFEVPDNDIEEDSLPF
ncbi:MAG: single-stranded DNA-binding protein [Lewinella sp.]|uniref:single-stranded DNA-binding protein n=1 Tax=Lewinella sp. TaxID=2004506 RepID=UPI003D6C3C08